MVEETRRYPPDSPGRTPQVPRRLRRFSARWIAPVPGEDASGCVEGVDVHVQGGLRHQEGVEPCTMSPSWIGGTSSPPFHGNAHSAIEPFTNSPKSSMGLSLTASSLSRGGLRVTRLTVTSSTTEITTPAAT